MKLLNVGCGSTFHPLWSNIDRVSYSSEVKAYDLLKGLPYEDSYFDACYSSHLLEHLTQTEAQKLLSECWRTLKPQGVIRIVVPDLESVARNYLNALEQVEGGSIEYEPNYNWMMLELYDQAVRRFSGGEMALYLSNPDIKNKDFVRARLGAEAEKYFQSQTSYNKKPNWQNINLKNLSYIFYKLRVLIAKNVVRILAGDRIGSFFTEGLFWNSGEVHRWMYDRFSLRKMLEAAGFVGIRSRAANESQIPDFNTYELDIIEGKVRKPESLFMEGTKL
ncbi:MAG: methyltransferase domain-containing protein [Cyanosarcina radialis HA8281-LM2]|jgi:predicted SAM-dependent methyltransferase|nr:methyltransferase domain-containing protein [Cyanosarcina radialis HA8281-LM2]